MIKKLTTEQRRYLQYIKWGLQHRSDIKWEISTLTRTHMLTRINDILKDDSYCLLDCNYLNNLKSLFNTMRVYKELN